MSDRFQELAQLNEADDLYKEAEGLARDSALLQQVARLCFTRWLRVIHLLKLASRKYSAGAGIPNRPLGEKICKLRAEAQTRFFATFVIDLVALMAIAIVVWCILLFPRPCCVPTPTPTRTIEPTPTATVTPTPIKATITCSDDVAQPIRFGEPITLSYRNTVIISLSRDPVNSDSVPDAGQLIRVSGQEFTYSHKSLDFDMLNFTFPAESEGGQPANKTIPITFVPESGGLCGP
jgi:hypothetical protein